MRWHQAEIWTEIRRSTKLQCGFCEKTHIWESVHHLCKFHENPLSIRWWKWSPNSQCGFSTKTHTGPHRDIFTHLISNPWNNRLVINKWRLVDHRCMILGIPIYHPINNFNDRTIRRLPRPIWTNPRDPDVGQCGSLRWVLSTTSKW